MPLRLLVIAALGLAPSAEARQSTPPEILTLEGDVSPVHDLLVFHAYDGTTGRPALQISTIVWEEGWPRVGELK